MLSSAALAAEASAGMLLFSYRSFDESLDPPILLCSRLDSRPS